MTQLVRGSIGGSSGDRGNGGGNMGATIVPPVDVFARNGDLVVRAELPGIDPEKDVTIEVQDHTLVIRGQRQQEERIEEGDIVRIESVYGSFNRMIQLPDGVNPDDIRASYNDGVLEVVVPKAAEMSQGKRIPIQSGSRKDKGSRSDKAA
ncbi:MAG: Hsp20/alpha crystallin family protein [Actinomycetota bacterium]